MEIDAVHPGSGPEIPVGEIAAVVVQRLPVGGQRHRDAVSGPERQPAQRRVQIGEVQIEFVPGGIENVQTDLGEGFLFVHRPSFSIRNEELGIRNDGVRLRRTNFRIFWGGNPSIPHS